MFAIFFNRFIFSSSQFNNPLFHKMLVYTYDSASIFQSEYDQKKCDYHFIVILPLQVHYYCSYLP